MRTAHSSNRRVSPWRFRLRLWLIAGLVSSTLVFSGLVSGAFPSGASAWAAGASEEGERDAHSINWYYGLLGENEDIEHPTLLYRPPGMPVPYLAYVFNSALLFFLLYYFGKRPVLEGLKKRRQEIMRGMDEAAKMKAEAEGQLAQYQAKLDGIEAEVERIHREMREAAEAERKHIVAEAKKRRERMDQEAKQLIVQELKAAREQLFEETVRSAVQSAQRILGDETSNADHQRLSEEYLGSLKESLVNARGGQA